MWVADLRRQPKHNDVGEVKAPQRSVSFIDPSPRRAVSDDWSERGEQGRWVRVHVDPRVVRFDPWRAPRGPGRRTKLKQDRITQGIYEGGGEFQETDKWQDVNEINMSVSHPWTGRTIFMVDKRYSKEYGTDQRRQSDRCELH